MSNVTKYQFTRKVQYLVQNGLHFEHPIEGHWTGFIIDKDFNKLVKGETLTRTVDEFDSDHGFDTSEERNNELYTRPQVNEVTGRGKDFEMMQYPFTHGTTITIKLQIKKVVEGENAIITIQTR